MNRTTKSSSSSSVNVYVILSVGLFFAVLSCSRVCNAKPLPYHVASNLQIGSFNIQSFGQAKIARPEFIEVACRILSKYDIILVQEIKDTATGASHTAARMLEHLNAFMSAQGVVYSFKLSPRLGLGTYKEQYAVFYRSTTRLYRRVRTIDVEHQYVYDDVESVYDRPPHIVNIQVADPELSVNRFSLVNVHIRPTKVVNESLELRDVVDEHRRRMTTKESNDDKGRHEDYANNIAIMGDFNFDCDYVSRRNKRRVVSSLSDFTWYIIDGTPTTISKRQCSYDRILIAGERFKKAIVQFSNQTFFYNLQFGMSDEETKRISDHYPVEFQLA